MGCWSEYSSSEIDSMHGADFQDYYEDDEDYDCDDEETEEDEEDNLSMMDYLGMRDSDF
jgi:hypothetical protein